MDGSEDEEIFTRSLLALAPGDRRPPRDAHELEDLLDASGGDRRTTRVAPGPLARVWRTRIPVLSMNVRRDTSMTTPFPSDHEHAAWDREYVERFWAALDWTDRVLEECRKNKSYAIAHCVLEAYTRGER